MSKWAKCRKDCQVLVSSCSLFCPELTQFHEVFRYLWRLPAHSAWVCAPREQYITPGKEDGSNSVACIPCSAPLGRNLPIVVRRPLLTQHRRCLARMWKVCWVKVSWRATCKHAQLFTKLLDFLNVYSQDKVPICLWNLLYCNMHESSFEATL